MKYHYLAAILVSTLFLMQATAKAAWHIDTERFHTSVHGQLSCQECHEEINEEAIHPNPANVNKTLKEFFHFEQCTVCHEDVADEIAENSHAGQAATSWQNFANCIECHNPHYQLGVRDDAVILGNSLSAAEKCSLCHKFQAKLPEFSEEDRSCLQCHAMVSNDDPRSADKMAAFCLYCHSADNRQTHSQSFSYPLIDETEYGSTPHAGVSCMVCHPRAAEFRHSNQPVGDCRQCHRPHDEKVAHDAHAGVTCGGCHLRSVIPVRESDSGIIRWHKSRPENRTSPIHQMQTPEGDAFCRTCHMEGNSIGAAAMVLPAKSVICMPCHPATFSIGDTVTILSMILFLGGFTLVGSIWFSAGDRSGDTDQKLATKTSVFSAVFSSQILAIIKSLILDGLLQRRLFRISKERWLLHALILYPFIFRFIWGLIALVSSLWRPEWTATWAMLNKNHPLTAFLFDLSGMMVIIGFVGMIMRRLSRRPDQKLTGLPTADWPAYALLGSIIIGGFILEGMRIAMTGSPGGAPYAFVGDAISRVLSGFELTGIYGYMWYLHAILTGAFVVYLPFSRMLHMIIAPVSLAMNAASQKH